MARTTTTLAVICVACTALAAGCGNGGTTNHALTKAQVIRQGGAICRTAERQLSKIPDLPEHPFGKGSTPATHHAARLWLVRYAALLDSTRIGLKKLAAPAQDRQLLDGYLNDIGVVVTRLRAASKAPAARVEQEAGEAFQLFERASSQTKAYGFPKGVCGAGSSG